jgi:myb proto-oncogene protein
LVKKEDNDMSESSMSESASLLEDLDDLIVDPYENEEEDEQKSRYVMNNISSSWFYL